jgi:hypothetical protein
LAGDRSPKQVVRPNVVCSPKQATVNHKQTPCQDDKLFNIRYLAVFARGGAGPPGRFLPVQPGKNFLVGAALKGSVNQSEHNFDRIGACPFAALDLPPTGSNFSPVGVCNGIET